MDCVSEKLFNLSCNIMEDPTENVQELFVQLDKKFFQSKLKAGGVILEWNDEASNTAGYCYQLKDDVRKVTRCYIVLNKPLLMLRKRQDLVETLLHEMIHAMLFLQGIEEKNGGHGPNFRRIMNNINKVAGTNITIYHEFHDAVDHCKDLSNLKKAKAVKAEPIPKKPSPKPVVSLKVFYKLKAIPKHFLDEFCPVKPLVVSPRLRYVYSKVDKTLAEINKKLRCPVAPNNVKLIRSEYVTDSSDYDSDADCDSNYMNYTKRLKDCRP